MAAHRDKIDGFLDVEGDPLAGDGDGAGASVVTGGLSSGGQPTAGAGRGETIMWI